MDISEVERYDYFCKDVKDKVKKEFQGWTFRRLEGLLTNLEDVNCVGLLVPREELKSQEAEVEFLFRVNADEEGKITVAYFGCN